MTTHTSNKTRLQTVSRWLHRLSLLVLITLPLVNILIWMNVETFLVNSRSFPVIPDYIGPLNLFLGFLAAMIPVWFLMIGVWNLSRLFASFAEARFFTGETSNLLLSFTKMLICSVLATPIAGALTSVAVTMNYPEGQRMLSFQVSNNELSTLFIAAVFLAIAWVLREAQLLAKENAEFV